MKQAGLEDSQTRLRRSWTMITRFDTTMVQTVTAPVPIILRAKLRV